MAFSQGSKLQFSDPVLDKLFRELGVKVYEGEVPIDNITVPQYQRRLSGKYKAIAGAFNPLAMGRILLAANQRKTSYNCVDGQNRLEAMRELGVETIPAVIISGTSKKLEGMTWIDCNRHRKMPKRMEIFRVMFSIGDKTALAIRKAVKACGFDVAMDYVAGDRGGGGKLINAISILEDMFKERGVEHMQEVLTIIGRAWSSDFYKRTSYYSLSTIDGFLMQYWGDPNYDPEKLVKVLQKVTPEQLISRVAALREVVARSARIRGRMVLQKMYNKEYPQARLKPVETQYEVIEEDEE